MRRETSSRLCRPFQGVCVIDGNIGDVTLGGCVPAMQTICGKNRVEQAVVITKNGV